MIKLINKSKADFLWVSFGCPKQERWIIDNINNINVPLSFGIGAAFDFLSGNVKRAPKIIQEMKLEWFYRFLQEPGRLWKRYFIGGIGFAEAIIRQKFSKL
jgi:N-acetylglucosaminyldiphosphoundecaprenol N-acetyl-beta-D-mannosaminyltransferase